MPAVGPLGSFPAANAAMAFRSLRRAPSGTPSSRRCSSVRSQRTSGSIAFSRNTASYRSRPRLRSQSPSSITGLSTQGARMIVQGQRSVQHPSAGASPTVRVLTDPLWSVKWKS